MKAGCASGVSGVSNKILKTYCTNRDPKALEFVTYLVNFILRGWISDKDWDLIANVFVWTIRTILVFGKNMRLFDVTL